MPRLIRFSLILLLLLPETGCYVLRGPTTKVVLPAKHPHRYYNYATDRRKKHTRIVRMKN